MEEQAMKISRSAVRRLRTARGWSQEQLAIASGLSLRTVQRVEADGTASMATKVSLAATYGIPLDELDDVRGVAADGRNQRLPVVSLFLGIAIMTCALISESGRLPGLSTSSALAAVNLLVGLIGASLVVPAIFRLASRRQYAGAVLALLGTPLATLLVGGLFIAAASGRAPTLSLTALGVGGLALVAMALRELLRAGKPVLQERAVA